MPVIRPPRFDIKCKSPAAVWLRGFVFCAGQGRRLLLPQRALQHDVAEGQRVVQADFVGLAGNALGHKEANKETIMPIVLACMSMAKKYVGALIVIERGVPDRKSTRLNSSHVALSRMPSSA